MPKSAKERIQNGIKKYRKVRVVGGLELALELIGKGDRDDPKTYCMISSLTMAIPVMQAAEAALDDHGIDDEEYWDDQ